MRVMDSASVHHSFLELHKDMFILTFRFFKCFFLVFTLFNFQVLPIIFSQLFM